LSSSVHVWWYPHEICFAVRPDPRLRYARASFISLGPSPKLLIRKGIIHLIGPVAPGTHVLVPKLPVRQGIIRAAYQPHLQKPTEPAVSVCEMSNNQAIPSTDSKVTECQDVMVVSGIAEKLSALRRPHMLS